jgi:hypothetical protein
LNAEKVIYYYDYLAAIRQHSASWRLRSYPLSYPFITEPSAPFSDVLKSGLLSPLARMHGDDLWQEETIDLLLSDSASSPFVQKLYI